MVPSSTDLTYFSEAANQLNLSAAAKKLGISQPSLTLSIQRLEEAVGTPLLIRHKRGVTLTKAGQKLLAHTRELQDQWHKIKASTIASTTEVQGTISIGSHPSVALYSLSRFLPALISAHSNLNVQLKHDISRRITDEVINLSIDIGIAVNPEKHPDLVIKHLANDKVMLWSNDHPNENQDLNSGNAVIICDMQLSQSQSILKSMKKAGLEYGRLIPANSLEVIADLTKNGCGIGILPGNIAKLYNLKAIPNTPFHEDEVCLLYRGENRDVRVIQVIVEAIKTSFAEQC
jgi:DNA-binding transcriptional LysR family regulator